MAKLYSDTVLDLGPGAQFIKRPKYATIVASFEGGQTVEAGLNAAHQTLGDSLKSKSYVEDPVKYLRSYLPTLITAEALTITDPGTAPAPVAAPAPEIGEDGQPVVKAKRPRQTKAQKEAAAAEAAADLDPTEVAIRAAADAATGGAEEAAE